MDRTALQNSSHMLATSGARSPRLDSTQGRQSLRSHSGHYAEGRVRRFKRDEGGKRMAPLSQLNTRLGRKLANPTISVHARMEKGVVDRGPQYSQNSYRMVSPTRQTHTHCQQIAAPLDRTESIGQLQHIVGSQPHPACATRLSDRNLLASQRMRNQPTVATSDKATQGIDSHYGALRRSSTSSLRRTMTIRRGSSTCELRFLDLPNRRFSVDDEHSASSRQTSTTSTGSLSSVEPRRFSFDIGPEVLALSPCWTCADSISAHAIISPERVIETTSPKTTTIGELSLQPNFPSQLRSPTEKAHSDRDEIHDLDFLTSLPSVRHVRSGFIITKHDAAAQTFEQILHGIQRVPTALM